MQSCVQHTLFALFLSLKWFVFVETECADGYFGAQCQYQCHCADRSDICDKLTGQCRFDCAAGWTGTDCQTGLVFSLCVTAPNHPKSELVGLHVVFFVLITFENTV